MANIKLTLELDSVEDRQTILNTVNADAIMFDLWELKQSVRHMWKHEDMSGEAYDKVDKIYTMICELYGKYDLEEM